MLNNNNDVGICSDDVLTWNFSSIATSSKQNSRQFGGRSLSPQLVPETFTSLIKDHVKLKLNIQPVQFKKKSNSVLKSTPEIYEKVKNSRVKCKDINSGENIMFTFTFTCQDSRPIIPSEKIVSGYVVKENISYPEKIIMPINSLKIEIEFHYKNSIADFTKFGMGNEEDIVNSHITIIDYDDHQVYFKLQTNYFNEENEQLYRYIVIGKMDNSEHAFIFDVSDFSNGWEGIIPNNLKKIYDMCMPHELAKYFEGKSVTNSDKSIRRVGFGVYFRADTSDRYKGGRRYYSHGFLSSSAVLGSNSGYYGLQIVAEKVLQTYPYSYGGVINVGYYKFEMVPAIYHTYRSTAHYTCKLTQEVKYLK